MIPYIDTHCHLDLFKDIQHNAKRQNDLPIKTISVTNAPFLWEPNQQLFKNCANIRIGLGLHPELAGRYEHEVPIFETLCKQAKYIGEIGLDGSAGYIATKPQQLKVFRQVLSIVAKSNKKILTVHSRNAATETIEEIISYLEGTNHQVIMHWFSGRMSELELAIEAGFYFSVNHKMVSTNKGLDLLSVIPHNKILTETDAPFTLDYQILTREASLKNTITRLSNAWDVSFEEVKLMIWNNFKGLII